MPSITMYTPVANGIFINGDHASGVFNPTGIVPSPNIYVEVRLHGTDVPVYIYPGEANTGRLSWKAYIDGLTEEKYYDFIAVFEYSQGNKTTDKADNVYIEPLSMLALKASGSNSKTG